MSSLLARPLLTRLLDGDQRWGSLDVVSNRFGVTTFRLVVYPPGITGVERRRLRVWRGWPLWGATLWVLCELLLVQLVGPWTALGMSTTAFVVSGAVALHLAGGARSEVRTLRVSLARGHEDLRARAVAATISRLTHAMADADDRLAEGAITVAEHEMVWWRVYRHMAT